MMELLTIYIVHKPSHGPTLISNVSQLSCDLFFLLMLSANPRIGTLQVCHLLLYECALELQGLRKQSSKLLVIFSIFSPYFVIHV